MEIAGAQLASSAGAEDAPAETLGDSLIAYQLHMPFLVWDGSHSCVSWSAQQQAMVASSFSANDFERHHALNVLFCAPLIDRTATLDNGMKIKVLHPNIPSFDAGFNQSVDQLCRSRCLKLLQQHSRIKLLWSGGIDSTAVLVAFLRTAPPEAWKQQLSVHYCSRSVQENPGFFEQHVSHLPQHAVIEGHLRDFVFDTTYGGDCPSTLVTGDPGDILFGGMLNAREFVRAARSSNLDMQASWRKVVPELMRARGLLARGQQAEATWCAWIGSQVEKSPVPVESALEFVWWINFSCKLQADVLHLFFNQKIVTHDMIQRVEHFFLSDDWQQWALHHREDVAVLRCSEAAHKLPLKQYIHR